MSTGHSRNLVGGQHIRSLKGELHMVKAGFCQGSQPIARDIDPGGDQVGVDADAGGMADHLLEVLACRGLAARKRSEEHTSELQSRENLVCRLLLEKKKQDNHWIL